MKNICVLILIFHVSICCGQSHFSKGVKGLQEINYEIQPAKKNKIAPENNWFNSKLRILNESFFKAERVDTVNFNKINSIEYYYVKGKKPIKSNLYGKASIEKWKFIDSSEAIIALKILDGVGVKHDIIRKDPWIYWIDANCIYFILADGWYNIEDLPKIKNKLKEKIKNGG